MSSTATGHRADDEGFTLIEAVVSMLIFALLSSAVVGLIIKTTQTTGQASNRTVAANLAERQKEYLLGVAYDKVPSGTTTTTQTLNSVSYSVKTTISELARTDSGNTCDATSGAQLEHKRISIDVSWPRMGSVEPIHNETVRAIPQAASSSVLSTVVASVKNAGGTGIVGIPVSLVGSAGATVGTASTDAYGCAVFSNMAAASYNIKVNQVGYVGVDNLQQQALSFKTSVAGQLTNLGSLNYDLAGSVKVVNQVLSGYTMPTGTGAYLASVSNGAVATGTLGSTVPGLYPTSNKVFGGLCDGLDTGVTTQTAVPSSTNPPTVTVPMGKLDVKLNPVTLSAAKVNITIQQVGSGNCNLGSPLVVASNVAMSGGGNYSVALPSGFAWTVNVTNTVTGINSPYQVTSAELRAGVTKVVTSL